MKVDAIKSIFILFLVNLAVQPYALKAEDIQRVASKDNVKETPKDTVAPYLHVGVGAGIVISGSFVPLISGEVGGGLSISRFSLEAIANYKFVIYGDVFVANFNFLYFFDSIKQIFFKSGIGYYYERCFNCEYLEQNHHGIVLDGGVGWCGQSGFCVDIEYNLFSPIKNFDPIHVIAFSFSWRSRVPLFP
ncbi:MAG: hypothetical protein ABIN58_00875 [candidate division WOR-3 bacterium]